MQKAIGATILTTLVLAARSVAAAGLQVAPPAPFIAELTSSPQFAVDFGIRTSREGPQPAPGRSGYLCEVGFVDAPARAPGGTPYMQEELNAGLLDPAYVETVKGSLAEDIADVESGAFALGTVSGLELWGPLADTPGASAYIAMMQTPLGLIEERCNTIAPIATALPAFRAIRDTIVPPT
jgi:hypothetical protein